MLQFHVFTVPVRDTQQRFSKARMVIQKQCFKMKIRSSGCSRIDLVKPNGYSKGSFKIRLRPWMFQFHVFSFQSMPVVVLHWSIKAKWLFKTSVLRWRLWFLVDALVSRFQFSLVPVPVVVPHRSIKPEWLFKSSVLWRLWSSDALVWCFQFSLVPVSVYAPATIYKAKMIIQTSVLAIRSSGAPEQRSSKKLKWLFKTSVLDEDCGSVDAPATIWIKPKWLFKTSFKMKIVSQWMLQFHVFSFHSIQCQRLFLHDLAKPMIIQNSV
jgi:hypothetical protein